MIYFSSGDGHLLYPFSKYQYLSLLTIGELDAQNFRVASFLGGHFWSKNLDSDHTP